MNFAFNNAHYPPPSFGKDLVAAFLALLTYTRRPLLILPELSTLSMLSRLFQKPYVKMKKKNGSSVGGGLKVWRASR